MIDTVYALRSAQTSEFIGQQFNLRRTFKGHIRIFPVLPVFILKGLVLLRYMFHNNDRRIKLSKLLSDFMDWFLILPVIFIKLRCIGIVCKPHVKRAKI